MPSNVLLCRWLGGWWEVADEDSVAAHGRREALLGLGAAQSVEEVEKVAREQLAIYADPRTAITAGLAPAGEADRPYAGFGVGDRIWVPDIYGTLVRERVVAVTVSMDVDGLITYAPDLRDAVMDDRERWEQNLKKMSAGAMRGTSKVATPAGMIGSRKLPARAAAAPTAAPGEPSIVLYGATMAVPAQSTLYNATGNYSQSKTFSADWLPAGGGVVSMRVSATLYVVGEGATITLQYRDDDAWYGDPWAPGSGVALTVNLPAGYAYPNVTVEGLVEPHQMFRFVFDGPVEQTYLNGMDVRLTVPGGGVAEAVWWSDFAKHYVVDGEAGAPDYSFIWPAKLYSYGVGAADVNGYPEFTVTTVKLMGGPEGATFIRANFDFSRTGTRGDDRSINPPANPPLPALRPPGGTDVSLGDRVFFELPFPGLMPALDPAPFMRENWYTVFAFATWHPDALEGTTHIRSDGSVIVNYPPA